MMLVKYEISPGWLVLLCLGPLAAFKVLHKVSCPGAHYARLPVLCVPTGYYFPTVLTRAVVRAQQCSCSTESL